MPTPYVEKLARKHGMSVDKAEEKWSAAKQAAKKQGHGDDYAYITSIFKSMMSEAQVSVQAVARLKTLALNPGQDMSSDQMLQELSSGLNSVLKPFIPKDLIVEVGKKKSLVRVGRPSQAKAVMKMLDGLDFVTTYRLPFGYVGGVRQDADGTATIVHYENHTGVTVVTSSSRAFNP